MESVMINGQEYKIGLHGRVFVKRRGEWAWSQNMSASDVEAYRDGPQKRTYKERGDSK